METPVTYATTPISPSPSMGEAGRGSDDHLATAIELLADLEDNLHANPVHWVNAAQAHALIDIAQSLRSLSRIGIAIQYR